MDHSKEHKGRVSRECTPCLIYDHRMYNIRLQSRACKVHSDLRLCNDRQTTQDKRSQTACFRHKIKAHHSADRSPMVYSRARTSRTDKRSRTDLHRPKTMRSDHRSKTADPPNLRTCSNGNNSRTRHNSLSKHTPTAPAPIPHPRQQSQTPPPTTTQSQTPTAN